MGNLLIGRQYELDLLQKRYESNQAELVVVYGRRRVGKTFLVQQAFGNQFAFHLTGIYKVSKKQQLRNFASTLANHSGRILPPPRDWYEAFQQLRAYLETLGDRKSVVFIDEMPWLDTAKSDLVSAFEQFWNGWGNTQPNLKIVLCGSATSWMVKNIFQNKGGLFNRDTPRIALNPFNLQECEAFCQQREIPFSRYHIAQCYMILGGIPYYWDKLQKGMSLAQNIDALLFSQQALLKDEFAFLYATLFHRPQIYEDVVALLSQKHIGFTMQEIAKKLHVGVGGNLTKVLKNLQACNMVLCNYSYGEKKELHYQLADFFTLFYLRFVKDNFGKDYTYWQVHQDKPDTYVWRGYAFQMLCEAHIKQLRHALRIDNVGIEVATFAQKGTETTKGAQIDLLIKREDKVVNLCEMKCVDDVFEITKSYSEQLLNKVQTFQSVSPKRTSTHLTMVTTFGIKPNKYASLVQQEITLDDLFA